MELHGFKWLLGTDAIYGQSLDAQDGQLEAGNESHQLPEVSNPLQLVCEFAELLPAGGVTRFGELELAILCRG